MNYSIKQTIRCNMGCEYCYESAAREQNPDAGKQNKYNSDLIIDFIKNNKTGSSPPTIHGGEPLITPKKENEKILKAIFEKYKSTSIQTNGSKIDKDYIEMFKKYKTHVGVSIDGPEELNMARWMGSEDKTIKTAIKIMENIKEMKKEGISVGIISVISKVNGTKDKIEKLKKWLLELKEIGITSGRMHTIQVNGEEIEKKYALSEEEKKYFYKEMIQFLLDNKLSYAPFTDAADNLLGYGIKTCVSGECDPYHTTAEKAIYGDGSVGNCLRTADDGVVYLAEQNMFDQDRVSNERYVLLRQIPQEDGGCKGCRFWNICKGDCPMTSKTNDWREKTENCEALYYLYSETEKWLKNNMPNITLVSELKLSDNEINELLNSGKLYEKVFEKMNTRRSIFN